MNETKAEIKLFVLTKYMMGIYNDENVVLNHLVDLLGDSMFWNSWFPRYHQINSSRETQAALFRMVDIPYRKIQSMLRMSPKTIQEIMRTYKLNYTPLDHISDIAPKIMELETRLKERNLSLW